jgi:hypothetical protein
VLLARLGRPMLAPSNGQPDSSMIELLAALRHSSPHKDASSTYDEVICGEILMNKTSKKCSSPFSVHWTGLDRSLSDATLLSRSFGWEDEWLASDSHHA